MTPILIVALPKEQAPLVWWSSTAYVIGASARFDDPAPIGFKEAFARYAERHDEAHWFESHDAARTWAASYTGSNWLELRAMIARTGMRPPNDLVVGAD